LGNDYISDNPGRVATEFQFSSLFMQLGFRQSIQQQLYLKVELYPFNAGAIKPYTHADDSSPSSFTSMSADEWAIL